MSKVTPLEATKESMGSGVRPSRSNNVLTNRSGGYNPRIKLRLNEETESLGIDFKRSGKKYMVASIRKTGAVCRLKNKGCVDIRMEDMIDDLLSIPGAEMYVRCKYFSDSIREKTASSDQYTKAVQ